TRRAGATRQRPRATGPGTPTADGPRADGTGGRRSTPDGYRRTPEDHRCWRGIGEGDRGRDAMGSEDVWHYLDVLAAGPATPRERTLDRMRGLVDALGNPQHAAPSIHVTGTNGKGSTVAYAAALLAAEGARVGTYTSPHLHHVTERVTVDGEPVDEARFAD